MSTSHAGPDGRNGVARALPTGSKAMSIRLPIELAAAAEYAERAVDRILVPAPTAREIRFAEFDL